MTLDKCPRIESPVTVPAGRLPQRILSRWARLGVLACALLVISGCLGGHASARREQGNQHHGLRFACAHHTAPASQCPPLFDLPLPSHPRLLHGSPAASRAMIQRMFSMGDVRPLQINPPPGDDFGIPFFYPTLSDPLYTVRCNKPLPRRCPLAGWRIRIPAGARPADGSDGSMAVIDQTTGREYDLWRVQTVPLPPGGGRILIGWGGRSRLGQWGAGSPVSCAGATCTPQGDTVIRYQELADGHIDHALYLIAGCSNGRTVYPASAAGGGGECDDPTDAPATGQWLQLNMSQRQIGALHASSWQKAIYRALARYGGMVADEGSSGAFDVQLESPEGYTSLGRQSPFVAWAASQRRLTHGGISVYLTQNVPRYVLDLGGGINWQAKLRVIDPCVISGSC